MNTEKIYENSSEREFLKELYSRRRIDRKEDGIQAIGLITKDNSYYKINEDDGLEPHLYSYYNLLKYIKSNKFTLCDRAQLVKITREISNSFNEGFIEVRMTSSPINTVISVLSYSELNYFQLKSIYVLALNALSLGFENITLGVTSKNLVIDFNSNLMDSIEVIEKKIDELNDSKKSIYTR